MIFNIIEGDLIQLAKEGRFKAIVHGVNCFCFQGAGIALQMKQEFNTDIYRLEEKGFSGDYEKLGRIEFQKKITSNGFVFYVINAYTQYYPGPELDYEALTICLRKINMGFERMDIGLPMIGAGIGGGDWNRIESILKAELKDCNVTIVKYKLS